MISRTLEKRIIKSLQQYPIVGIVGPRQSGKTTLAKQIAPNYTYVNLEDLSLRQFAQEDPKGFLETYKKGCIIDEIQYAPDLFSYLQVYTDERQIQGEYIITGSQNFLISEKISQSLAGRIALFDLLPLSYLEIKSYNSNYNNWEQYLIDGSYPKRMIANIDAHSYYQNYIRTYIEKDVRQIKNIKNLTLFQKFLQLLAGRVGQLFNQSNIGNELGVDNKTVNEWMSVLEASYIAFRLQPYYNNFNKRIIKTPKIYFYDTGILCYLLNIRNTQDLLVHFARGQLFENLIMVEIKKLLFNKIGEGNMYFWQEHANYEVDLLIEQSNCLKVIEMKSGKTIKQAFLEQLQKFNYGNANLEKYLIYGGNDIQKRSEASVLNLANLHQIFVK